MPIDITVYDEIGWRLPPELLAEDCLESDESAQHVAFELIQVDKLATIMFNSQSGVIPDGYTNDFFFSVTNSVEDYVKDQYGADETTNTVCENVYDLGDLYKEWAESVNDSIQSQARSQLEDRESGDYWRE
jgi:hypothetical protein